jgi:hypothetical protein
VQALLGSLRYARAAGAASPGAAEFSIGDAVQVHAYEHSSGLAVTPLRLRYVPVTSRGGAPVELDAPAAADAWSAALGGRMHAGIFRVSSLGIDAFGGAPHYTLTSGDGARALQRSAPHAPGGWAAEFSGGVLARAAARDAPCAARGFAVRPPPFRAGVLCALAFMHRHDTPLFAPTLCRRAAPSAGC